MQTLHGSGVGGGIAIGPAYVLSREGGDAPRGARPAKDVDAEVRDLECALVAAAQDLRQVKTASLAGERQELAAFLDAHILMISDPSLKQAAVGIIRERNCSAEAALLEYRDQIVDVFERIEDPYLRAKKDDVSQIISQIVRHLPGGETAIGQGPDPGDIDGYILIAHDLSPADMVRFKNFRMGGFVTDLGSPVSHLAILAHSLHIPAAVGMHGQISRIPSGATVAIDATAGTVIVDPSEQMLDKLHRRQREYERRQKMLVSLVHLRPATADGREITLLANVDLPADIEQAASCGASGVGLYRTEFLFMNRATLPDEEEQFEAYADAARTLDQVTIRTLDLGADKQVDGGREQGRVATNPALGIRAVRLCLQQPELFRPQMRAIYRSSAFGNVRCMIPMLSSIDELRQVQAIVHDVKLELEAQGAEFNPDMPIGGMIEVPAAAISADLFAQHLDFLSIGTNDLIQYTLAIDRIDDEVNHLYDPMNLSVLRLIKNTIDAGVRTSTPVSMCGEMAGDPAYTRLLLGMGLREFSISPSILPEIKHLIRGSRIDRVAELAGEILIEPESLRRRALLEQLNDDPAVAESLRAAR